MNMKAIEDGIDVMLRQINNRLNASWSYSRYNDKYIVEDGYETVLYGVSKREIYKALTAVIYGLEHVDKEDE